MRHIKPRWEQYVPSPLLAAEAWLLRRCGHGRCGRWESALGWAGYEQRPGWPGWPGHLGRAQPDGRTCRASRTACPPTRQVSVLAARVPARGTPHGARRWTSTVMYQDRNNGPLSVRGAAASLPCLTGSASPGFRAGYRNGERRELATDVGEGRSRGGTGTPAET